MHVPPRWVVAVSLAVAATILGDSLLYAVLPTVWSHLGLEVSMVGVLLSANRVVRLLSNPLAGWVMARAGARGPLLAAVLVAAGTTAAYASGLGFIVLLAARALWGVCWSFLRLGGYLAALEASDEHNRGYYLGFFYGVTRLGSFVAVLAGGLLTDLLGFHATVVLFAAVTLAGGLALLREHPPRPASRGRRHPLTPAPTGTDGPPAGPPTRAPAPGGSPPDALLEEPALAHDRATRGRRWTIYGAVFLHGMVISGLVTSTLGLWLLSAYGPTPQVLLVSLGVATLTGSLLAARFLADFLWGPLAGHLSDRYGRMRFTLLSGAVQSLALVALGTAGNLGGTLAAAVGLFLAAPALQVSLDAQAGGLAPPGGRARTMGWYTTWLDLGAALGPLAGYFVGVAVGLDWMYRGSSALFVLAGLVYIAVFRLPLVARGERGAAA